MSNSKKVLVIGWDAADWKVIHPLMDAGALPNLKNLVESGVMSEISTLHPVLSPMLWTSIATGKRPFKHGIHGFVEPTFDNQGIQPITNLTRKTKTVWNILNQNDLRSIVVGWWPSHPAEPIDGVMVSNSYQKSQKDDLNQPWPMRSGTVHPPKLSDELAEFRFHPAEIDENVMRLFIPKLEDIDQEKDGRLWMCANMIAETTSIQGVATHLMETQEWDFAAVYFDAIDHFSHGFMKYHPPMQAKILEKDFELFKHVVQCGYVYHDMMLGNMLKLVDEDTTVILLSDHGFHPDHLRPVEIPNEPAGPAIEHRDFGIFVMKGPRIKKDNLIHGVSLLDITPTVLEVFDLPVGEDMDGRVIADAFETTPDARQIESWDSVPGNDGQHPPERKLAAAESEESIKQLVDLGYVEPLDADKEVNVRNARQELNFNLARSYMDADQFGSAVELMFDLYLESPAEYRYGIQLAMCFRALNRSDDLNLLVKQLRQRRMSDASKARDELNKYKNLAVKRNKPSSDGDDDSSNELEIAEAFDKELFSKEEQRRIQMLVGLATVNRYALDFLEGFSLFGQKKYDEAIVLLTNAMQSQRARPAFFCLIADIYLKMRKWDEAQGVLEKAKKIDPSNQNILLGLGNCYLGRKENREAAEFLRAAISQTFHFPMAHYSLGVALHRMGEIEKAIDSFKESIAQNPNNALAYGRLAYIHKNALDDRRSADEYFSLARDAREATREMRQRADQYDIPEFDPDGVSVADKYSLDSLPSESENENMLPTLAQTTADDVRERIESKGEGPFVTIVTGLPRTGTSMMMQMLNNGGLAALTDGNRIADDDNPRGYLELDSVKRLASENSWVIDAEGKAVKVIAQLLQYLPKKLNYRVIFMDRPMPEVLASQKTMLDRNRAEGGDLSEEQLQRAFVKQLRSTVEMLKTARIPSIRVQYHSVVDDPMTAAKSIEEFLKLDLDLDAMAKSVDESLYHQKVEVKAPTNAN